MHAATHKLSLLLFVITTGLAFSTTTFAEEKPTSLFDGKTFDGWEVIKKDQHLWKVSDGSITGGSLKKKVPHNTFIATKESFQNFDLKLKVKISGTEGFINSGIQIRSIRVKNSSEMSGYQVDAGNGWWGKLYDESRRNKVIGQAADLKKVQKSIKKNDWNEIQIRTEGKRIRSWINGVAALDYIEKDANIALDGKIGFQVHGNGKALVQFKDVTIIRLPSTPGVMIWKNIKQRKKAKQLGILNQ